MRICGCVGFQKAYRYQTTLPTLCATLDLRTRMTLHLQSHSEPDKVAGCLSDCKRELPEQLPETPTPDLPRTPAVRGFAVTMHSDILTQRVGECKWLI
jgi:hypothetical protein